MIILWSLSIIIAILVEVIQIAPGVSSFHCQIWKVYHHILQLKLNSNFINTFFEINLLLRWIAYLFETVINKLLNNLDK